MADVATMIQVLMRKHKDHMDQQARQYRDQRDEQVRQQMEPMVVLTEQVKTKEDEVKNLIETAGDRNRGNPTPVSSFQPFGRF